MKNRFDRILGNLGQKGRRGEPVEKLIRATQIAQLEEFRRALLASPRYTDQKRLLKFGYRVYSQSDEDGILHEIFQRIGEGSRTFCEIGTGDGLENNTLFLLVQGWRGVWLEASAQKVASAKKKLESLIADGHLRIEQGFVSAGSVDATVRQLALRPEIDLLSLDIDGNDYYILQAITSASPRVVVVEYNAKFPPEVPWVMEYNEAHQWDSTDYFGASLGALEKLLSRKGYSLVGCNLLGCNAFFVRNDLVSDQLFCHPFTAQNHYEPPRYFLLAAYHSGFPPGFGPFQIVNQSETSDSPVRRGDMGDR
jgi:hypothetical protein